MKKLNINEDFIRIIISGILLVIGILLKNNLIMLIISYVIISKEVYFNAFKNIKKKEVFDENLLMIIATLGSFYIKEYPEAVLVMLLFSIGEFLSDQAVDNSKKEIIKLMDLRSDKARLKDGKIIDTKKVKLDEIIIVNPGEKIPLDGIIVKGSSHLDTKNLTGESIPCKVKEKDKVLSGTINLDSVLEIKTTSTYKNSTASKIIDIMEHADEKKAKTEKFITKFSKIYTPIVVVISVLIVIIPTIMGYDFNTWLYRALEVLVISCPCALVISVPLGYFAGIGRASKEKILIKGSNELDSLNDIENILFDKTGTLTEGVFEVTKIISNKEEVLKLAANAEKHSNHPIAKSIIKAYKKELNLKVTSYKEIAGNGIMCKINKEEVCVGTKKLLEKNKIKVDEINSNGTIIYVGKNKEYIGSIIISDKIRDNAKDVLTKLRNIGVENLVVLSGDKEKVVENIAKELKLDAYHSELLPEDKIKILNEYLTFGKTAFIGDGINDAPVIKLSDIGISLGGIGSDATIEASDIVLMNDNLEGLITAIKIGKLTKKIIISNIIMAISFKVIMLLLAIFGLTPIWLAVFADVGVTLLSVLNSLRILKKTL